MKYNTSNRSHFLETAQLFTEPFTAKDLYDLSRKNGNPISLSTIYRLLGEYSTKGSLCKIVDKGGTIKYFLFQSCNNDNHFYLKCEKCRRLTHIDCHHIHSFTKHLAKKHSFEVSNCNLVISGTCASCTRKK